MTGRALPALLLAVCIGAYLLFLRGRLLDRFASRGWIDDRSRSARYAFWCAKAALLFGGMGFVGLAGLGRIGAIAAPPPEFAGLRIAAAGLIGGGRGFPVGLMLGAMVAGGAVGEFVAWLRRRDRPYMLGDIGVLMPRDAAERRWGFAMAVVAGVAEELFFRLAVPLLIALLTGSASVGFAAALAMFAMAHRYQGWVGVGATAFVGLLMSLLYLASGTLWLAMLIHGFIDFNGLVLRPWLRSLLPPRRR